jgi:hypothetical protein
MSKQNEPRYSYLKLLHPIRCKSHVPCLCDVKNIVRYGTVHDRAVQRKVWSSSRTEIPKNGQIFNKYE